MSKPGAKKYIIGIAAFPILFSGFSNLFAERQAPTANHNSKGMKNTMFTTPTSGKSSQGKAEHSFRQIKINIIAMNNPIATFEIINNGINT